MLVKVNDDLYVASNRIIKVTADYQNSKVTIFTDDGQQHSIRSATGSMGVYNTLDALVDKINNAFE